MIIVMSTKESKLWSELRARRIRKLKGGNCDALVEIWAVACLSGH